MKLLQRFLSFLFLLLIAPAVALAQYPSQPIRLVVGFPPGTGPDIIARLLGQELSNILGQNVVVENRTGAGGQIAAQVVAHAKPDGYTLLLGEVGSLGIAPAAFTTLTYDPLKDFSSVTEAVRADFVLVVPTNSPHKSLEDFVKAAKESGSRVNFATFGAATPGHFGAELFAKSAGFDIEPIHYRSTGDAVTALISGDAQAGFLTTAMASQQVAGGKMRALATSGTQRANTFPDFPTLVEAGYPDVVFSAWVSVMAPKGTPADVIDTLQKAIAKALENPELKKRLDELGFAPIASSPADMDKLMQTEIGRWKQIVQDTGFNAQ